MAELFKRLLLPLFKLPATPPEIPADLHTHVEVFRASPRFLRYQLLVLALGMAPAYLGYMVGALLLVAQQKPWTIALAVLLLLFALAKAVVLYVSTALAYDLHHYIVTDRSLRIRQGIWTVQELTLTFVNVQNVIVDQGPIERWLGIANVVVETAGGAGALGKKGLETSHQGVLRGISNAGEVRDLIRSYLERVHRHAGLGDADDVQPVSPGGGALDLSLLQDIRSEVAALGEQLVRR